jgi:hypothetical protein
MRRVGWLAMAAMLAALTTRAQTIVAEPFPPAKFSSLYLECDDNKGGTVSIQLQGDTVIYQATQGGKVVETRTVQPSGDDWFNFIQALNNSAKVYKWAAKYYYPGQGPSWVIDFDLPDRKFKSEGTNEFPLEGNEGQPQANPKSGPSVPFQLFWQAALKLAGKSQQPPSASK